MERSQRPAASARARRVPLNGCTESRRDGDSAALFIGVLLLELLMVTYVPAIPLSLVHLFYG